ncbi:abortive phage infection protein [Conexibacter arvalis]|uniref:Abortive infection protein n=1 Tax=Conexibacter arvalis TaxID=912552 RepID=A0A840IGH8_9ACTN|nr:abortive phage infection protein [Conexibacter arvalis]MBB4663445.1 hypothetical protein [Conexibacter arvalis]
MRVGGISYAVDDDHHDLAWAPATVRRDLLAIRDELRCNAVMVYGRDVERLEAAGAIALELGLDVWVQPRLAERRRRETVAHLARGAEAAERLRVAHPGRVTFVAGCEHSLFARGLIPGPHLLVRLRMLRFARRFRLRARIRRRLDALLGEAVEVARARFGGPVTYGAGYWEEVDWSRFDLVGVNLYRMGADDAGYAERVRALVRDAGKPVAITEFGCCPHRGAERSGPAGFTIVNWLASPPRVKDGAVRDEATQAAYLDELIALYEEAGVDGAFVFTFAMPAFPHRPDDPRHDLDMASFGVVKVSPDDPHAWERKAAFDAVAARYGALATRRRSGADTPA